MLRATNSSPAFAAIIKEGQPCETGARHLQSQLSVLQECDKSDPFKDIAGILMLRTQLTNLLVFTIDDEIEITVNLCEIV